MSDSLNLTYNTIDEQNSEQSASTRRQLVAGAAVTLGGLGLLSMPELAGANHIKNIDPQTILNVAATAEVLATIVNTVGFERRLGGDDTTQRNIEAAAREELIHYDVLVSSAVGGKALTKQIHVPDEVFSNRTKFLEAITYGDQVFINAYMIGTTVFGNAGNGRLARITSEFMGVEAVHRALARQSLGRLGNDRAFVKYSQPETADGDTRTPNGAGFQRITTAVTQLEAAGFGFGKAGSKPGQMFDFDTVRQRTPNPADVNTRSPR